jgi:hypothetical protein
MEHPSISSTSRLASREVSTRAVGLQLRRNPPPDQMARRLRSDGMTDVSPRVNHRAEQFVVALEIKRAVAFSGPRRRGTR